MTGKNISEQDNEQAGRLLLFGAIAIVAVVALAISPILIGGFLIGLIWYGAYTQDGEKNGNHLIWPIGITLVIFIWLFGMFPPFTHWYQGALFTDFQHWTGVQIGNALQSFNSILPKKFELKSVTIIQVQMYFWCFILMAVATLVYLHFRGSGGGGFLYRSIHLMFAPLRLLGSNEFWIIGQFAFFAALKWAVGFPKSVSLVSLVVTVGLFIYRYTAVKSVVINKDDDKNGKTSGPITLGYEKGKPHKKVMLTEDQLNHHVHIVGASGFGKSILLSHIVNDRITSGSGLMLVDLKADFETIRQVVSTAQKSNRLDDLLIFSCGNPEISSPYNVLAHGTANQLKDRIMGALSWSEEYYKNESASFLLKLLRGLAARREQKGISFDLHTVLNCIASTKAINEIAEDLRNTNEGITSELEALSSYLAKPENTKSLQGLKSQLESLLLSDFGHLLAANNDGIDLLNAIKSKKIVYLLLDSRTYGESSRAFGKLILQDLKAASAKIDNEVARNMRSSFTVVVDEFADMATEDFIGFLDRARSSKIGVVVAHQEIADLSMISPEFARRLMNSTSTLFSFLQKLPDSSELISGIAGTRRTKEVTEQAKSNWIFGDEKTGMKSIKEVDEFVLHPNLIRSLGVGECALVQKYPRDYSVIMKVHRENTDHYLPEDEVRKILSARALPVVTKNKATVPAKTKQTTTSALDPYWSRDTNI